MSKIEISESEVGEFCTNWTGAHGAYFRTAPNESNQSIQAFVFQHPSALHVWTIGLLFVTAISLCAAVGITLMPFLNSRLYNRVLTYFVGLGVGSLSGSAVFHLIPQAFGLLSTSSAGDGAAAHDFLAKSWLIIVGIYLFFFVDKIIKIVLDVRKKRKSAEGKNVSSETEMLNTTKELKTGRNGGAASNNGDVRAAADQSAEMTNCTNSQAVLLPNGDHHLRYHIDRERQSQHLDDEDTCLRQAVRERKRGSSLSEFYSSRDPDFRHRQSIVSVGTKIIA